MDQPVPHVSSADLARILQREFPGEAQAEVATLLEAYDGQEAVRVMLAILKLAGGHVSRVREYLEAAGEDYRDVLAWAEYPEFIKDAYKGVPAKTPDASIARDWEQYETWLKKA
jgi:hypothetical protein